MARGIVPPPPVCAQPLVHTSPDSTQTVYNVLCPPLRKFLSWLLLPPPLGGVGPVFLVRDEVGSSTHGKAIISFAVPGFGVK